MFCIPLTSCAAVPVLIENSYCIATEEMETVFLIAENHGSSTHGEIC